MGIALLFNEFIFHEYFNEYFSWYILHGIHGTWYILEEELEPIKRGEL